MAIEIDYNPVQALQSAGAVPKLIRGRRTFTGAANNGNLGDTFPVFTVSGLIFVHLTTGQVSTTLVCSAASQTAIQLDLVNAGSSVQWQVDGIVDVGTILAPNGSSSTGALTLDLTGDAVGVFINDNITGTVVDLGTGADVTAGAIEFYLLYTPISSGASVALGTGMAAF